MYIAEFNAKYGTRYANFAECYQCQMHYVKGIIVGFLAAGVEPTKERVVAAWNAWQEQERQFSWMDVAMWIAYVKRDFNEKGRK